MFADLADSILYDLFVGWYGGETSHRQEEEHAPAIVEVNL
jgi:hypothetical protein